MEDNCKRWVHYSMPRPGGRPKLTLADQERFLERKRRADEQIAKFVAERRKREEAHKRALAEMEEQQRINRLEGN